MIQVQQSQVTFGSIVRLLQEVPVDRLSLIHDVISTPKAGEAILCQVTSTHRDDGYSEAISKTDFSQGRLDHDSYARVNPLFTVDVAVILRTAGRLREERTAVILDRIVSTLQNS
jgi:hypothetical protein